MVRGVLHSISTANLNKELYDSNQAANSRDQFSGNKYVTPMVANGRVYVARQIASWCLKALGRPIAFAQTPIEQVRQYSKEMALMLEWFENVGYSADIAGLEREFGRPLTKLGDWARVNARPVGQ